MLRNRFILLFFTAIVLASFLFVGIGSVRSQMNNLKNTVVATLPYSGRTVDERQLRILCELLNCETSLALSKKDDLHSFQTICKKGILSHLIDKNPSKYKKHLKEVWNKIRQHRLYEHNSLKISSTPFIWKQLAPEILSLLNDIRMQPEFNDRSIDLIIKLYLEQRKFSPKKLYRFLSYQQRRYLGRADYRLSIEHLAIASLISTYDWFSNALVKDVALLLLYGSDKASSIGYTVNSTEVINYLKAVPKQLKPHSKALARQIIEAMLLFQSVEDSVIFTPQLLDEYCKKQAIVNKFACYSLPESLMCASEKDLLTVKKYKQATIVKDGLIPQYRSLEDIPQRLISRDVECKISIVSLAKRLEHAKISIRDVFDWQITDEGWAVLMDSFSYLPSTSKMSRADIIDSLDSNDKKELMLFSKKYMLKGVVDCPNEASKPYKFKMTADFTVYGISNKSLKKAVESFFSGTSNYIAENGDLIAVRSSKELSELAIVPFKDAKNNNLINIEGESLSEEELSAISKFHNYAYKYSAPFIANLKESVDSKIPEDDTILTQFTPNKKIVTENNISGDVKVFDSVVWDPAPTIYKELGASEDLSLKKEIQEKIMLQLKKEALLFEIDSLLEDSLRENS